MTTLLQLNTSLFSDRGQSSQLTNEFVAAWRARHPQDAVIVRDLAAEPVPHLTAERFQAFIAKPELRTPAQQEVVRYSDSLISEIKRADIIAIGLPLYNFSVPSTLKAYFDHIARAGITFRYGADGKPVGLLTAKKAYVFATRGGFYAGTALDSETNYVRDFLHFLGIADVEFVYAEGLAVNEATKQAGLAQAKNLIRHLLTEPATAAA